MIERIALKITNFIFNNTELNSELFDVYKYGVEITISTILNIFWIIMASVVLSDVISGVIYLAVFIMLRTFVGGYHAKTYYMCNALFLLTYLLVYYINSVMTNFIEAELFSRVLTILILLEIIPIIAFAPIQHVNKPLNEKQSRICRIIGIAMFIMISITALGFHYGGVKYGSFIIMTLAAVSVLILIEIIKRKRRKKQ